MASSGSRSLDVQPISVSPKLHPPPLFPELTFSYRHSKDGIDTNLLILLHGLGDTLEPFDRLAASLALPQTATLTIQGTLQVPLLEEKAFQWWHSFDDLGELIAHPNPTATVALLERLLLHLTTREPNWTSSSIHLFGFAQGGTAAAELALAWSRRSSSSSSASSSSSSSLGSLVTVSAPLISFPTDSHLKSKTPALVFSRKGEERTVGGSGAYRKGFENVLEAKGTSRTMGMLQGKEEWNHVMTFWANHLRQRSSLEFDQDVYEVRGGIGSVQSA